MRPCESKERVRASYQRWYRSTGEQPERWAVQTVRSTKQRAVKKGLECTITAADILPLPEICPLLGLALDYSKGTKGRWAGFRGNSPSLDRIDNTKGYVPGNVWVISYRANSIKRDATLQELQDIAAILTHATKIRSQGRRYQ